MKRWRYNVYRVPPRRDETSDPGDSRDFAGPAGGYPSGKEMAELRQADSVYEDVM